MVRRRGRERGDPGGHVYAATSLVVIPGRRGDEKGRERKLEKQRREGKELGRETGRESEVSLSRRAWTSFGLRTHGFALSLWFSRLLAL